MNEEEKLAYLINLVVVARSDDQVFDMERRAFDRLSAELGASAELQQRALNVLGQPTPDMSGIRRLSDKVRNLEDMVEIAICDGELTASERDVLVRTAADLGLGRELIEALVKEVVLRFRS